ncbi:ANR52 phosphatase, partial [Anthoscopus minutus]|nr:ANR52 phosphatase [Anthoscopus minutus]
LCVPTGANVNAKDTVWLTPLHRAAASRHEVCHPPGPAESLGNVHSRFFTWFFPCLRGFSSPSQDSGLGLGGKSPPCSVPTWKWSWSSSGTGVALLRPCHTHTQMVNLLLNKGASPSTCDKKDRQPLHWAAFLG